MFDNPQQNAVIEAWNRVSAFLASEQRAANDVIVMAFGAAAAVAQADGSKPRTIVWVPGDDNGNPAGVNAALYAVEEPRQRGDYPVALNDVLEQVTIYCWAGDPQHATMNQVQRDLLQYADASAVWDAHHRALRLTCPGLWAHVRSSAYRRANGARWGFAIRSVYTIQRAVLDLPFNGEPLVVPVSGLGFDVAGVISDGVDESHVRKDPV